MYWSNTDETGPLRLRSIIVEVSYFLIRRDIVDGKRDNISEVVQDWHRTKSPVWGLFLHGVFREDIPS